MEHPVMLGTQVNKDYCPPTACFCTRTRPYPVTLLPIGWGYFLAKPSPV